MNSRLISMIPCMIAFSTAALAETRSWKSLNGAHTMRGEFIRRDASSVTLRNENGKELTIELTKLHPDETAWLNLNHSLAPKVIPPPAADPSAFFDNLTFQDTRESTLAKLKISPLVELTTDETFIGRSGLNGIFRTRKQIGNLNGFLYFAWSDSGKLTELTLQTDSRPATSYKAELEPGWQEFIDLLTTLYGNPIQKGPLPSFASLKDGTFMPSHLWKIESGGSVLLGTAQEGENYQLVVRFTQKKVGVVEIP